MGDPVLWTGLVTLVGALAAVASRALRIPAACGALVSAALLAQALDVSARLGEIPYAHDGVRLTGYIALTLLCLGAGAEIRPGSLSGDGRWSILAAPAQAAAVFGAVFAAGRMLGVEPRQAALLGAACVAASPAAIAAVAAEGRAQGAATQRALRHASVSVAISLVLIGLLGAGDGGRWSETFGGLPLSLLLGGLCGLAILMPLSRLASRPAIVACLGIGSLLLAGVAGAATAGQGHLVVMSLAAGVVISILCGNRTLVREALRDLAMPCAVVLFALSGTALPEAPLSLLTLPVIVIVAARALALVVAGAVTMGPRRGAGEALALIPMMPVAPLAAVSGATLAMPLVAGAFVPHGDGANGGIAMTLLGAALLSVVLGTIATRRSLARAGDVADITEAPESWRATMR